MSHISLHKSATACSLLLAGILGGALAIPATMQLVEQPTVILADSTTNIPQSTEEVNKTALTLAVVTAGGVAVGLTLRARNGSNKFPTGVSSIITIDSASYKLQKQLLLLLHEDKKTANRLITQAKQKYPNKTANWYVEKVIYDLKRDRGA
ncbi:hypothetical protein [Iningainema tapete]|uniref:Uncharacterized protein n=1 Tax=Iningainema tapete BLCC-T55 TaxID=2748662 RepID=A0A8J6XK06_9CYAN|nr:hypothetical protein [Iningainema tapete]MBD2777504.1 hypothetical protein [Iningainema tapete BLCC-T55]